MKKHLLLLTLFLLGKYHTFCQYSTNKEIVNIFYSKGIQNQKILKELDHQPSYEYSIVTFDVEYIRQIGNLNKKKRTGLEYYYLIQNHIGFSKFKRIVSDSKIESGKEIGINTGVQLKASVFPKLMQVTCGGSVGLYYVTGLPVRQRSGLIFCDTGFLGIIFNISDKLSINTRVAFRHLSNASIAAPNGGINSLLYFIGISLPFE